MPSASDQKTKTPTKREVGERVDIIFGIEPEKTKQLANGVFEATITTSATDRMGESIDTAGIDTSNYMQAPVVLYGHDYEGLPIGKTLKLTEFKNKIKAQFQLAVGEYPFAATVAALIKGGYLNATSIGGIVKEWSDDFRTIKEMEMIEFSVVPVPANQEALITSRALIKEATGKEIEEIRQEFQDFSHKVFVDKLSNMPQDEIKEAVKVLKNLTDRLEDSYDETLDAKDKKLIRRYVLKDAQSIQTQSQKIIKIIKLSTKEKSNE